MSLKLAIDRWQAEVDEEAVKLIEMGVPPYEAGERARVTISSRRRAEHERKVETS